MPRHNATNGRPAIEDRYADTMPDRAIRHSGDTLVAAQLNAGQHFLELLLARAVAARIGIDPRRVRPGIGDPLSIGAMS